jgi:hypothetical protein
MAPARCVAVVIILAKAIAMLKVDFAVNMAI